MGILKRILNSFIFWGAWILIPVLMEIVPALGSFILLLRRRHKNTRHIEEKQFYPEITLIVPVYNSADTLYACVKSIYDSDYPTDRIQVYLVNNQGQDNSFGIYAKCQEDFSNLHMTWMNAAQGKSRALNLALYNSEGKYIINIDSDGVLEREALKNMITRFENDPKLNCMTGAILTTPDAIKSHPSFWGRLLRSLEYMEYAQAFLAGRSYASEINSVYTLSGAFSAFRKSAILKSRLYNTDTICEDTQLTFQMRDIYGERVEVCENAIFLVDPIESVNKLYTQRQRWQRGSLEVAKQFCGEKYKLFQAFTNVNVKTLLYDHTFAFPRMIWYLALICLLFMNYSGSVIIYSTMMIFSLYIFIGYVYFIVADHYLKPVPELEKFYRDHWCLIILLPFFNLMVFFIRIAGIINSIGTDSAWKTMNLTDEKQAFASVVKGDFKKQAGWYKKITLWVNKNDDINREKKTDRIAILIISNFLVVLSSLVIFTVSWISRTYNVSLSDIVNTMQGTITGTGTDVIIAVVKGCVLPTVVVLILVIFITLIISHNDNSWKKLIRTLIVIAGCVMPFSAMVYANYKFNLLEYYEAMQEQSQLYEKYYVDPDSVTITASEKTKNIIYIYLESMETTYADTASGGIQSENLIPNLTEFAMDNTSFSNTEGLGGFHTMEGFGYTVSAMFSMNSGLPFKNIIDENNAYTDVTTLGDILAENGYSQEFLCGSDASFGGRDIFYKTHGNYEIFDLFTAREKGYIDEDYYVWWGFEDTKLFEIARDEVTRLAAGDEPFNLTMLTVDTHHIGGYVCAECGNEYDVDTANVVACTDRQLNEFVEWCKQQPFYDDTVIIITGDHPRMDTYLVEGEDYYSRTEYNCFMNSSVTSDNTQNREFTAWDIFPTTLAAMGFEIDGDQLGLGVNLFSDKKTLAEKKGFTWLQTEANKSSDYYISHFID